MHDVMTGAIHFCTVGMKHLKWQAAAFMQARPAPALWDTAWIRCLVGQSVYRTNQGPSRAMSAVHKQGLPGTTACMAHSTIDLS